MKVSQNIHEGVEDFSSKIGAKIWGHRFTSGQRGPEYVLEFLNVLLGTNYTFEAETYKRRKAIGFRKFIFEGDKEGSKQQIARLEDEYKEKLYDVISDKEKIMTVRDFFKNLEVPLYDNKGKPADRSWYAKSLYPLHESLLFFEVRVKGSGKNKSISFERNFYARGGELYFLMIKYGTENNPELRNNITERLNEVLKRNKSVSEIASNIEGILSEVEPESSNQYPLVKQQKEKEFPYLPITDHPLFEEFSLELSNLLSLNMDIYEMFQLLTSLVSFQLTRYMYDRARINEDDKSLFFVDCLDGRSQEVLRLSSGTFKNNEGFVRERFEYELKQNYIQRFHNKEYIESSLESWKTEIGQKEFLSLLGLSKLKGRKDIILKTLKSVNSYEEVHTKLFESVKEVVISQLQQHQLNILRILARDGGLGGYRSGTSYRYFFSDRFLQMLTCIHVPPETPMEFSDFLELLYKKFGFVIGQKQARDSGLYDKANLNISYFQNNESALREKLKNNGLLIEYSDATAMIKNPFKDVKTEGVKQ
ncbi:hypothetical protein [Thalassobacillus sp. C254]|uniref:hypothetical protein n=1 Tax=Thalassobacillus sp. C254 TaxID=1225341 RepID=UPI0006D1F751|nr:hypothetical protein [Thalassobacillus sp. C254]